MVKADVTQKTTPAEPAHLPGSFACRPRAEGGLGLRFTEADGVVTATFDCAAEYCSYPDRLHGGIAATALDAAMTYCLFAQGLRGMTGQLTVRYPQAVTVDEPAEIRAWVEAARAPLYILRAELRQGGAVRAHAEGKFKGEPLDASTSSEA
jgi:acyl-coenzyme A thioesterase PaaI-like protein